MVDSAGCNVYREEERLGSRYLLLVAGEGQMSVIFLSHGIRAGSGSIFKVSTKTLRRMKN